MVNFVKCASRSRSQRANDPNQKNWNPTYLKQSTRPARTFCRQRLHQHRAQILPDLISRIGAPVGLPIPMVTLALTITFRRSTLRSEFTTKEPVAASPLLR